MRGADQSQVGADQRRTGHRQQELRRRHLHLFAQPQNDRDEKRRCGHDVDEAREHPRDTGIDQNQAGVLFADDPLEPAGHPLYDAGSLQALTDHHQGRDGHDGKAAESGKGRVRLDRPGEDEAE